MAQVLCFPLHPRAAGGAEQRPGPPAAGVPRRCRCGPGAAAGEEHPLLGPPGRRPPHTSPSACPAVSEEGWTCPNTHPLLRNRETSAEAKDDPAKPPISFCQQGFCPKRWRLAPFCSSCLLQEQSWGTGAAAGGKCPTVAPCPKTQGPAVYHRVPMPASCLHGAGLGRGREAEESPSRRRTRLHSVKAAGTEVAVLASPSPVFPVRCVA